MKLFQITKKLNEEIYLKGDGVIFDDETVVIQWDNQIKTIVIYKNLSDVKLISDEIEINIIYE